MAHIYIKSEKAKQQEDYIADCYHVAPNDKDKHDIVEMVSARTTEAYNELKRMEGRKYF